MDTNVYWFWVAGLIVGGSLMLDIAFGICMIYEKFCPTSPAPGFIPSWLKIVAVVAVVVGVVAVLAIVAGTGMIMFSVGAAFVDAHPYVSDHDRMQGTYYHPTTFDEVMNVIIVELLCFIPIVSVVGGIVAAITSPFWQGM